MPPEPPVTRATRGFSMVVLTGSSLMWTMRPYKHNMNASSTCHRERGRLRAPGVVLGGSEEVLELAVPELVGGAADAQQPGLAGPVEERPQPQREQAAYGGDDQTDHGAAPGDRAEGQAEGHTAGETEGDTDDGVAVEGLTRVGQLHVLAPAAGGDPEGDAEHERQREGAGDPHGQWQRAGVGEPQRRQAGERTAQAETEQGDGVGTDRLRHGHALGAPPPGGGHPDERTEHQP